MAIDTIKSYGGSTLVYIGEGGAESEDGESGESGKRGDVTGGPKFRRLLGEEWQEMKRVVLPNWPMCHDDVSLWTRRNHTRNHVGGNGAKIGGGSVDQSCVRDSQRFGEGRGGDGGGREGDGCGSLEVGRFDFKEGSRLRGEVLRSYNRMWEDAVVGHVMARALKGNGLNRSQIQSNSLTHSQRRSQKLSGVERKVLQRWGERAPFRQKLMLWPLLWVKNML